MNLFVGNVEWELFCFGKEEWGLCWYHERENEIGDVKDDWCEKGGYTGKTIAIIIKSFLIFFCNYIQVYYHS